MTPADRARFHSDPANWKLGIFYFCRSDPRILVPKRIQSLGWTLNFARPMTVPFFLFVLALIPGAGALARSLGVGAENSHVIQLLVAIGIIVSCYRLSHSASRDSEPKLDSKNSEA